MSTPSQRPNTKGLVLEFSRFSVEDFVLVRGWLLFVRTSIHDSAPRVPQDSSRLRSECRLAKAIVSPRARTLNKPLVQCKELLRSHHPRDGILQLFGELLDAVETPKMNVHKLPGLRRKISDDFVARGERLAPIDVIRLKHAKNDFMRHIPSLEHGTFRGGRGVVMVASARRLAIRLVFGSQCSHYGERDARYRLSCGFKR